MFRIDQIVCRTDGVLMRIVGFVDAFTAWCKDLVTGAVVRVALSALVLFSPGIAIKIHAHKGDDNRPHDSVPVERHHPDDEPVDGPIHLESTKAPIVASGTVSTTLPPGQVLMQQPQWRSPGIAHMTSGAVGPVYVPPTPVPVDWYPMSGGQNVGHTRPVG
jgi:hypothetical protein